MPEANAVREMFGEVAPRYDMANRVLSGGIDLWWRHRLVRIARRRHPKSVVDLATGSGDVAFALRRGLDPEVRIEGMDFCLPMLDKARERAARRPQFADLKFSAGDCLDLPFPEQYCDLATISFGLRNLEDRARGLAEMRRILRPGGALLVLEFSQPWSGLRPVYGAYLRHILPVLAGWLTGRREAYDYLADSIEAFPNAEALDEELLASGFGPVRHIRMTGGIVALHEAEVPAAGS